MTDGVASLDDLDTGGGGAPAGVRHSSRLSDKILVAFHHACDQDDLEVADGLMRIVEKLVERRLAPPDANRRRNMESLVAAHERLWHLRRPGRAP